MKKLILICSLLLVFVSPFIGEVDIDLHKLTDASSIDYRVLVNLRIPHIILAFLAGGILSLSGVVFQVIFRNPISTPYTLGVASGATLFSAIAIILGFGAYSSLFAFVGAMSTVLILFAVAMYIKEYSPNSLLLIGIALSFFYSATLMVMFYISTLQESYEILRFTMGSLDTLGYKHISILFVSIVLFAIVLYRYKQEFRLLLTSYEFAHLQGIKVKQVSYILLFGVSIVIGVCVSITGPIGFVGLVIPHIIKAIYKQSTDKLLVEMFFYGGVFLVLCDLIARNMTQTQIPIGIVTSFIGAPFFIYLLVRK